MRIELRDGRPDDAGPAMDVIRRSITDLCGLDHGFDGAKIANWVESKTPAMWLIWIAREDARVVVAQRGADIVGIGMVDRRGKILLNYVDPVARFCGVSLAIMSELEETARSFGVHTCVLDSTETAKDFYLRRGYEMIDVAELRMQKRL